VSFSLYLLGDAFYRWDGFRYYASFTEFIPSVALVTILWSFVAVFTAMVIFVILKAFEGLCKPLGLRVRFGYFVMFSLLFVLLIGMVFVFKRLYWPDAPFMRVILLYVFLASVFLTWLFRARAGWLSDFIQDRITPLVWLFGVFAILSFPIVIYHTWLKQTTDRGSPVASGPSGDEGERPNIILITFDALSARNMSVYGYHRDTTPFIRKWAKTASLFKWVEAESGYTIPTTASLMTGKRVWTHQRYHLDDARKPVRSRTENIAYLLKKHGYYNMAFITNVLASVDALGIDESFDVAPVASELSVPVSFIGVVDNLLLDLFGSKIRLYNWIVKEDFILEEAFRIVSGGEYKTLFPVEKAFDTFLEVLDGNPPEPFFVWIHLYPPHAPYMPPEPFIGIFDSSQELRSLNDHTRIGQRLERYRKNRAYMNEVKKIVELLEARYDEFIRYCDKGFEDFIARLEKKGKLENTVIILSSDHGEEFKPHHVGHKGLSEEETRIPLIIKEPDQTEGRVIDDLVEQIDIPATILDLAGIPIPSWMEGRSLVPLIRGGTLPPRPAFSMSLLKNPARGQKISRGTIVVWKGDYKLVYDLEDKRPLLFRLQRGPHNVEYVLDKEPDIAWSLLDLIKINLKRVNEKIGKE
jgi:arylsulfatase A-like enzyme